MLTALDNRYYQRSLGDMSGHDNHGNPSAVSFSQATGMWTLNFDGSTSYVDCGSDASLDVDGSYTIGILVASDNITATSFIFGRYNGGLNRGFGVRFNSDGTISYFHTIRGSTEGGLLLNTITTVDAFDDGAFHWVVAKFEEGVGSSLFVDGVFAGSDNTRTDTISAFTQTCYIGRQDGGTPNYMDGRISEVVLWAEAVSEIEMLNEMGKIRKVIARRGRPAEAYHYPFDGQSLVNGVKGQPAISIVPEFGQTFVGGPRSDIDELDYFINLVENDNIGPDGNTESGETPCFSAVDRAHKMGIPELVCSTVGHSGYSITQLNKDTAWYDYLTAHIQASSQLKQASGKTLSVPAIGWGQGESDRTMDKDVYKGHLVKMQKDATADARLLTGQLENVPFIMYQMAYYSRLTPNVTIAQYELDRDDPNFFVATPMYHFPYDDGAHLTNIGYKWKGQYYGKVLANILNGNGWYPLRPSLVTLNGKIFTVTFQVPNPPLVIDTTNLGEATNYGFRPQDDVRPLTVTRVEVINATQVEVEVSETVSANPRVRYGKDYLGSGLVITGGASGNLRDSCPDYFIYNDQKFNLFNWCEHFEELV